ncbi:prostatic acid phosphatase-like [Tropilaelaps mercedesae]|uniref:2-phosphoxylose phosphatase 1 n=1 Tax=Tropilaelaps mercedesae TaxID=418985 RepID=A0A1V9X584_9ACAR|nr:prostatic acid phosphatase-like [Tropilaelaps mercedesae]
MYCRTRMTATMRKGTALGCLLPYVALSIWAQVGAQREDVFPKRVCERDYPCWDLRHVSVVLRHTARAPTVFLPHDPYLRPNLYPRGAGRSTLLGLQQALVVGRLWKSWWRPHFLSGDVNEVAARTSHHVSCFETTSSLLFEVYSPGPCHSSPSFCLPFDPVMIAAPLEANDENYPDQAKLTKAIARINTTTVMKTPVPRSLSSRFQTLGDFVKFVQSHAEHFTPNVSFAHLYEAVLYGYSLNRWEGLALPTWAIDNWPTWTWSMDVLNSAISKSLRIPIAYGVAQDVVQMLRDAAQGSSSYQSTQRKKLALFGYHDTTISALMSALDPQWDRSRRTSYLAAIFFELYEHENDGEFAVRVRYSEGLSHDGRYSPPKVLRVKGCNKYLCPLDNVTKTLNTSFTPHDTEANSIPADADAPAEL